TCPTASDRSATTPNTAMCRCTAACVGTLPRRRSRPDTARWDRAATSIPPLLGVHLGAPLLRAMSTSATDAALPPGHADPRHAVRSTAVDDTRGAAAA